MKLSALRFNYLNYLRNCAPDVSKNILFYKRYETFIPLLLLSKSLKENKKFPALSVVYP